MGVKGGLLGPSPRRPSPLDLVERAIGHCRKKRVGRRVGKKRKGERQDGSEEVGKLVGVSHGGGREWETSRCLPQ